MNNLYVIVATLAAGQWTQPPGVLPAPRKDPRLVRAARERAVARVPAARNFVESAGEPAVACLMATSPETGQKIADAYAAGRLSKLPSLSDFLLCIAQRGHQDHVALWALEHLDDLADPDSFTAWLEDPLTYTLNLRSLSQGAAEAKARRLNPQAGGTPGSLSLWLKEHPEAVLVGLLAGCFLLGWWLSARRAARSGAFGP